MWKSQARWKKSPPYFPATSALKAEFFSSPPPFWKFERRFNPLPPPERVVWGGGGAHYATVYENCAVYAKDKLPLLSSTFRAFAPPPPPPWTLYDP